jgi:hypothetical protein
MIPIWKKIVFSTTFYLVFLIWTDTRRFDLYHPEIIIITLWKAIVSQRWKGSLYFSVKTLIAKPWERFSCLQAPSQIRRMIKDYLVTKRPLPIYSLWPVLERLGYVWRFGYFRSPPNPRSCEPISGCGGMLAPINLSGSWPYAPKYHRFHQVYRICGHRPRAYRRYRWCLSH